MVRKGVEGGLNDDFSTTRIDHLFAVNFLMFGRRMERNARLESLKLHKVYICLVQMRPSVGRYSPTN